MKLFLEMFIWALENQDAIRYHHLQTNITQSIQDPDAIVNDQLNRLGLVGRKGARYAHSTSWRYETGRTLLTYLVWVDAQVLADLPTRRVLVPTVKCPQSRGPLVPRPVAFCAEHVLVHGLRHLRHLVFDRKDAVAAKYLADQETRILIESLEPAPSGRLAYRPAATIQKVQTAR